MNETSAISRKAARGTVWMTAATSGAKVLSVVTQLALAAILAQEDFGVIALCYTLAAFAGVVNYMGVREVLIRSQHSYRILLGSGLVLAVFASIIGASLLALSLPMFAQLWSEPRIVGPALILAFAMPFGAAATVVGTRLEVDMRFKTIALVQVSTLILAAVLSISLALAGAGVYSFVIPQLIVSIARLTLNCYFTRPSPTFRRIRPLSRRFFVAAAPMIIGAILMAVNQNADYAIIGVALSTAQVGYYYFAFHMSLQPAMLLNNALTQVLLPSLSMMRNDQRRQIQAMLESVRLVALILAGIFILQATLAGPFLRVLFGERWLDSILLLQMLSLAAAPTAACWTWQSLVWAQGRYWLSAGITAVSASGLVASVIVGLWISEISSWNALITLTAAVSILRLVSAPVALWVVTREGGVTFFSVIDATFRPAVGALISIGIPGYILSGLLSDLAMLFFAPLLLGSYGVWLIVVEWKRTSAFLNRLQEAVPLPIFRKFVRWLHILRN